MNILLHCWNIQKIKSALSLSRCTRPYPFQMRALFFNVILCKNKSANTPGFHFYNIIEYKNE